MSYGVRKAGSRWAIVNKDTGKVVGHSKTKANAQASANVRNAKHHDPSWRPTGKPARGKKGKRSKR